MIISSFLIAALFFVSVFLFFKNKITDRALSFFIGAVIFVLAVQAIVSSFIQYRIWSGDPATKFFIEAPLSSAVPASLPIRLIIESIGAHGYFFYYSWGHFVFPVAISIAVSLFWFVVMKIVQYVRRDFFSEGEPELALLGSIASGFPYAFFVVPSAFFLSALSLLKLSFNRDNRQFIIPTVISSTLFIIVYLLKLNFNT